MKKFISCMALAGALAGTQGCSDQGTWSAAEKELIVGSGDVMHVFTVNDKAELDMLRTPCLNMTPEMVGSQIYTELASKMISTVTSPEQDGVGIAGPQVGFSRRVVAVMRMDKDGEPFEVYPNIRITAMRGELVEGPEGCLSVPDKRGNVERFRDIDISYISPETLRDTTETVQGFTAVIFQHECDHLDGVLYIDKVR